MTRLSWIVQIDDDRLDQAVGRLRERMSVLEARSATPGDVVLLWADHPLEAGALEHLVAGPHPLLLLGPTLAAADVGGVLAEAAGVHLSGSTPVHDIRLRPGPGAGTLLSTGHTHGLHDHTGPHEHTTDRLTTVDKVLDDVEVLLVAAAGLADHAVMTFRASTGVGALTIGTVPESLDDRTTLLALASLVSRAVGGTTEPDVRVGLLGYGAIGHEHSRAVRAVDGLSLAAVCDTSSLRREAAASAAPGVVTLDDPDALVERDDVDLVVVSTPPSTHADWALRALRSGKHVVVEKPFAITTAEADEVLAAAAAADRLVVVYQNRRFDPDHLAVRRAIGSGALGEVFSMETFVGGFGHPCNLWHSDEDVSGGAFYDWGSHLIDQILDLLPQEVEHVTAAEHKRRWHDVTNADHSRVTIRFVDGTEAEFVHSDLAAALKPRWYVLGSEGALVGSWRNERIVGRNDIGTLVEDVLAPADSPPRLELYGADGSVTMLAAPASAPYAFHRELSQYLHLGVPMTVTAEQSRRVLAVMEAARASAADSGRPVVPA